MKATTIVTLAFLITVSNTIYGQTKTYYHNDTFDRTFTKCENPPMFGNDSLDLQKYMADKLQNQITRTIGQIKISILIDTTGKILCESIDNNSNLKMNKIKLDLLFDSMPNWNCAIQNGHKVHCVEQVVMTFNKQTLEVAYRIGRD